MAVAYYLKGQQLELRELLHKHAPHEAAEAILGAFELNSVRTMQDMRSRTFAELWRICPPARRSSLAFMLLEEGVRLRDGAFGKTDLVTALSPISDRVIMALKTTGGLWRYDMLLRLKIADLHRIEGLDVPALLRRLDELGVTLKG